MAVYSIGVVILLYAAYIVDYKGYRRYWRLFYMVEFLMLVLIVTCQWRMGGDNLSYEVYYGEMPVFSELSFSDFELGSRKQPFWVVFTALLRTVTKSFVFFHFVHCLILNVITFWFVSKYTKYSLSVIMIYVLTFNFFMVNIDLQRESLAVMTFLIMFRFLKNDDYIKYYSLWIICFLFHVSSVVLLLLPPLLIIIRRLRNIKSVLLFVVITSIILVAVYKSVLGSFTTNTGVDANVVEGVLNQAEHYNNKEVSFANSLIAGFITATPVFLIVYLRFKAKLPIDIFTQLCIFLIVVRVCNGYVTGIYRVGNYLLFPYYVCMVNTIGQLFRCKCYKSFLYIIVILTMIITIYDETRLAPFLGPNKFHYNMYVPYRTIFD